MDANREYKQIKSFFIIIFSIFSFFVTIILFLTFRDFNSLKEDYKSKVEKLEKHVDDLQQYSEKVIDKTESRGIGEIEGIKSSVSNIAKEEAINRINETFQYRNIEAYIDEAAKRTIDEKINQYVEKRVKDAESEIYATIEASLSLSEYMNMMSLGDPQGLVMLQKIIETEPNTQKGILASKVINIKSEDYRRYFENQYGDNLSKYLDYLEIKPETRSDKKQLTNTLIKIIQRKDQGLHEITSATIALEKMGYGHFDVFNFQQIETLKIKEKIE